MKPLLSFGVMIVITLFSVAVVSAEHPLPSDLMDDNGLISSLGTWASEVTYGMFWALLLGVFCFVLYTSTSGVHGKTNAFGFAGITGLFGVIPLLILGWVSWWIGSIFLIVGGIGIASMVYDKR